MEAPKSVSDYMRNMQRRSAAARKANLTPAQMSARMRVLRAKGVRKQKRAARLTNVKVSDAPH